MFYSRVAPNLYFGKLPKTSRHFLKLEELGVTTCLNVTEEQYKFKNTIYRPIPDQSIPPPNLDFKDLVCEISKLLSEGHVVYVNCRNGRGRSALVTSCIIGKYLELSAEDAMLVVTKAHQQGHGTERKWRHRMLPVHEVQKDYVRKFLEPAPWWRRFC